ncbi:MAG: LysM peptidoglycan-binding domain-containing protein, partial [Granulosicoccus sp.]
LADANNLTQNATVFPGQQLVIPGDLVKPDYDTPMASAKPAVIIDTQDIGAALDKEVAESEQLTLPADEDAAELAQTDSEVTEAQDKLAELAAISKDAAPYDLNTGETLWDFAKRTTGDATNWQAIADQNNFSEKQAVTVRPGQTIFVPEALLKTELGAAEPAIVTETVAVKPEETAVVKALEETVTVISEETAVVEAVEETVAVMPEETAVVEAVDETVAAVAVEVKIPEAAEQTVATALPVESETTVMDNAAELAASVSSLDETQPIKIVEAAYKTDDGPTPLSDAVEALQMVENPNIPAEIVVSGTYYPKAVYNSADFSSSLLMRVSPGTSLQVSRAMGTWFEVETDKGVGYVHQRDIK